MESDGTIAIVAKDLSKTFKNARIGAVDTSMREQLTTLFTKPWQIYTKRRAGADSDVEALKPVSFSVRKGEKLGILGRNGCGKSTLLKILARITEPTSGEAFIRGRIASILEVGTGFHPELTGAENVFLNGAILGLRREFVMERMADIVGFSEIGDFMNLPVKRYSSGMYVRLAFAVAAHLDSDVLLIDEVLAVGDEGFREKCVAKMEAEAQKGRTIVFVTHDMKAIRRFCDRVLHIDRGTLDHDGDIEEGIARYEKACGAQGV